MDVTSMTNPKSPAPSLIFIDREHSLTPRRSLVATSRTGEREYTDIWLPPSEDSFHRYMVAASRIGEREYTDIWLPPSEDSFHR
ncbi:Uncharacterized protein HZ326_29511, partial [Fusarium oxysporum f. sp. albedinis]